MKFIELFAGIGGFRLGLERHGHECVYSNEWLSKPASIYERNFGERPDETDIRKIKPESLPRADLICGGFPCATFSVAGKRTGFSQEDTRGSLFFEICRLLRGTRTPYVFLENVKGLLSSDNGRTFGIILSTLDELGYDAQWEVLNSSNFGVPQNRERVFIIGNLRGYPRPKVFPIGRADETDVVIKSKKQRQGKGVQEQSNNNIRIGTLCNRLYGGDTNNYYIKEPEVTQWRRGYFREYKSEGTPTLTANMGTGGHNVPFVKATITPDRLNKRQNGRRFKEHNEPSFTLGAQDRHGVFVGEYVDSIKVKDATKKGYSIAQNGNYVDLAFPDSKTRRGRVQKNSGTLMASGGNAGVFINGAIRKLTPLECERLQGLPDNFTKYYADGSLVSDSERYERCGRTVTINVIEEIAKRLHITGDEK